jgi:polyphenol oxidase
MREHVLIPDWPAPSSVRAAVTTRRMSGHSLAPYDPMNLGSRCGDAPESVVANRLALARLLDLPTQPPWLHQVHGITVHHTGARSPQGEEPVADAAVAHAGNAVLAILTADCLPLLLCTGDGSAIAAAHAGWRGLAAGVIETTVAQLDAPADRVIAWLGPAIGARSYEVGEEVRGAFVNEHADAAKAFTATRTGHWHCDLYALARQRLAAVGVHAVYGGGYDTFTDPRFYSYRRDPQTGRFASLIWRSDGPR